MASGQITIGSVTINKNPSYGTKWAPVRFNQSTIITANASWKTYDNGPEVIIGEIFLRNVLKSEGDSLRDYLTYTAIFGKNSFTITPPDYTDLGKADGVALTNAYFNGGKDLAGVFELIRPQRYNIKFPYWWKVV